LLDSAGLEKQFEGTIEISLPNEVDALTTFVMAGGREG
jgi:hypothetical protein